MYTRQYKTKKASTNSADTPASNQFAPRNFVVQPQTEEITNNQTPDLQTKSDKEKQSGKVLPNVSLFTNHFTQPQPPRVQMKLTIGQPGDKYEQEADRLAADVVQRINAPETEQVQRQELPEDEDKLQMKPMLQRQSGADRATATPDLEKSIQGLRGSGQLLAENIRQPMEQAFGADFSGVKVHTDAQSDQLNQSIQAKAFTTGQDIFFRQGAYEPGSRGGQELLAHELTHVVQQNGGAVQLSADYLIQRELAEPEGFDRAYLNRLSAEDEQRRFIKRYLGSDEVIDALDELYNDTYWERMNAKTTEDKGNVAKWWNRFKVFEEKRNFWKQLMQRNDFDIGQSLDEWLKLKEAYRRLESRGDDITVPEPSDLAKNIYDDMKDQFQRWDGTLTNRGAWWGSAAPGNPAGATNVPTGVIRELTDMTANTAWHMAPSWTGGVSFHRTRGAIDFIYHMQSPG